MPPKLVTTIKELRQEVSNARHNQKTIGLVPTMGALHEGHLSLVEECQRKVENAFIVVTIFVNPRQFAADGQDLQKYPRTLEKDTQLLGDKAHLVFAPTVDEIYPPNVGNEITVTAGLSSAAQFEGSKRVGHFDGVLTVVAKLFNLVQADMAFFGQKDAEQVFLIKRMVQQLNFPIQIVVVDTKRDADGLALSSRNQHLNGEERQVALRIPKALFLMQEMAKSNSLPFLCLQSAHHLLQSNPSPQFKLDYLVVINKETFEKIDDDFKGTAVALIAAIVGETRLIDNVYLEFL